MSRNRSLSLVAALVVLSGCAGAPDLPSPAGEGAIASALLPECPAPVEDQKEVTSSFLETLYPDADENRAIACKWISPDCSQRVSHADLPTPGTAVPTVAACRTAAQPLGGCYAAAVHRTLAGLDAGDASILYEAAVRTRDATLRAANDPTAPLWLRSFGPDNLLAKTFADAGVDVGAPMAACASGTPDQRYLCLATANRQQFRGLLALLDQHVGIVARNGTLSGASTRAWNVVLSATAPVHAKIVASGKIDPDAGIGMNRIDLLGKYAVLRALDGSTVGTVETHLAHLVTRPTYVPASAGVNAALFVPRFDVLLAAGGSLGWDEAENRPIDTDPVGARDLRALWKTTSHGIALSAMQGNCVASQQFQDLRHALGSLFAPKKLWVAKAMPIDFESFTAWDLTFLQFLVGEAVVVGRACGWVTSEDYVYSWTTVDTWYEYDAWEDCDEGDTTNDGGVVTDCQTCEEGEVIDGIECDCDLEVTCVRRNIFGACTMEYAWSDCNYIVEIEYTGHPEDHEYRVADAYEWVGSIRGAYREVMSWNDSFEQVNGEWVKRQANQGDGVYDLHYVPELDEPVSATIARAYVSGEQCEDERDSIEAALGSTGALTCPAGTSCGFQSGWAWPSGVWYPFPIATRLCPETAGTFAGVLADDANEGWCSTPWDYTKAVAHSWLPHAEGIIAAIAEEDALDGILADQTWQAEDGEDLAAILVEFFAEVALHAQPTGAMYLRQAQIAYSAGKLPTLDADPAMAGTTLGLTNVEAKVDQGLNVMDLAFELMLDFYQLEDDVGTGSSSLAIYYDRPIPKLALDAMIELEGGTVTNDYTSNRAMLYARLGDTLELHRRLVRMKLEILWRRADGFNACIDTGVCDPTAATGCAEHCVFYEEALAFTASASADLEAIDAMLAAHVSWLASEVCPFAAVAAKARSEVGALMMCDYSDPAGLKDYIVRLREHITGTQDELARAAESLAAGNDAFGFRGMNHYPGDDVDARITELVDDVRLMDQAYEGFVDGYLATLASYTAFEAAVDDAATNASGLIAAYCVDPGGVEQPGGCAVDEATWTTSTALVAVVNQSISDTLCAGTVVDRDTGETVSVAPEYLDDNDYTELFQIYSDYMTSIGLTASTCPQLTAPDFEAWDGYGGTLAMDLIAMQTVLEQLAGHLSRFRTELYAQDTMAEAVEVIQNGLDGTTDALARAQTIGAVMGCIGAIGATIATEGAAIGGAIVACSAMVLTAGEGAGADTIEELQMELDTLYANYNGLQNLLAIGADIHATLLQYDAAVSSFEAHRAQFLNAQANITADFRNLFENAFAFDPTNLLFADEQVESMVLHFDSAMRDVRELEILVGYDLGAPLAEDRGIFLEDGYYYLPRLADITVAESYGATGPNAYTQLAGAARPLDERNVTLVATASLLGAIHDAAQTLSGGEQTTHGFLSGTSASGFDASGNPESYAEWMLLRRSPFYNKWITSDPSADDDGDGIEGSACGLGFVDLYYYCPVPENTCLAVEGLAEGTRLNLAWADMQIVGIGASNFTCTESLGVYTIAPAVGGNGAYLDIEELNPGETRDGPSDFDWYLPDFMEDGVIAADDEWYRGRISKAFYDSQTPTVRGLIDAVLDMADVGVVVVDAKTFMPGSYLLGLPSSDSENTNAVYDPVVNDFDLEGWGLLETPGATETFAERLEDVTILCTEGSACQGAPRLGGSSVESHYARLFYSGPGQQSTVCMGLVNQGKSEWMVDDRTTEGEFAIVSTNASHHVADAEWMSGRVADPTVTVKAGNLDGVPLQAALAVIQVFGLTDGDGAEEVNPWVLHVDPDAGGPIDTPNLRVAFRYRYYSTEIATNAQWSEPEGQDFYESVTTCTAPSTYPW